MIAPARTIVASGEPSGQEQRIVLGEAATPAGDSARAVELVQQNDLGTGSEIREGDRELPVAVRPLDRKDRHAEALRGHDPVERRGALIV